jgi:hypothetical protein
VQPFLPPGVKVAPSATGVMSITINGGGSRGQYSCGLHGVAVEGMESPDGMDSVRGGQAVSAPVALHPDPAAPPLLARALAADPGLAGAGEAIVVPCDLAVPGAGDPVALLRLRGLTPSEAKLDIARQSQLARIVARLEPA